MNQPSSTPIVRLAFSGRAGDLALMRSALERCRLGKGSTILLSGESGVGKTRLADFLAQEAERAKCTVAAGRAYPVESGVPYALFSDALLPLLKSIDTDQLSMLARGGVAELSSLFPFLGRGAARPSSALEDPAEYKTRLFWTFTEFLKGLARRCPLLIVLDDLHWADPSSLELLHFVARQSVDQPILFLCTYNTAEREAGSALGSLEKSLQSIGVSVTHELPPLTRAETVDLIQRSFDVHEGRIADFAGRLYDWTKGNPFFLRETLQALVDSGRLHSASGSWVGWELERFEVAPTIRTAIAARLAGLGTGARALADYAAVIGTRCSLPLLRAVAAAPGESLITSLEELRRNGILSEIDDGAAIIYDFAHPMFRQGLYAELGIARGRQLHGGVAEALERFYGDDAISHADELAFHFSRADLSDRPTKAISYLAAAGASALRRHADREAVGYLTLALELTAGSASADPLQQRLQLDLARAHQRVGAFAEAIRLFGLVRTVAAEQGDLVQLGETERRLGLALFWSGSQADALEHFGAALALPVGPGNEMARARVLLARAACYQELGQAEPAKADIEEALRIAELCRDVALHARALRALLLLHTWIGPPELARSYGEKATQLAAAGDAPDVLFLCHWSMAVLDGLTGHTAAMAEHIGAAEQIAHARNSPLMRLWIDELAIEHASAIGDWEGGIARGENAIALARSLNQRTLLPRLLVWTSLMYLGRGELDQARAFIEESWQLSGAEQSAAGAIDVHTVVPAHIGRASLHLALQEYHEAIQVAEAGLAIADRSGYAFWAIHRVLPIIAEACCHLKDLTGAARVGERLQRDSERLGHKLGLAWAQACRAVIAWRAGDNATAARLMRTTADALEAIPILPDAARIRRQLAGRLADIGDRTGALKELRHVHEVFTRLGAELELEKARGQFRELGVKPPQRDTAQGAEGLTSRELAIAQLVARRKSNKAIGSSLRISPRTVSTHLSNIFRKLEVGSRAELTEYIRTNGLWEASA